MHQSRVLLFPLLVAFALPLLAQPKPPCGGSGDSLKFVGWLASKPRDHASCAMRVENGKIVIDAAVGSPAASCPDMLSWRVFADVVSQEFWKSWAADEYTWPNVQPYPLCGSGVAASKCCNPASASNPGWDDASNPAKFCPYFPGDHMESHPSGPLRRAAPPSKAHHPLFATHLEVRARLDALRADPDPGRKIRQSMAELVFRNRPMFEYVFENDLYNQEGIAKVFENHEANLRGGAPYRQRQRPGALTEIDFPLDAIMIKSNWINAHRAEALGLRDDPARPHVKMNILTPVTDNNGTILEPGIHWLVAFHVSTKDTPNWLWATFEHADNPGRCDYTGCNDSYGFASPDAVATVQADNFTASKTRCDDLLLPGWVWDTGTRYAGGAIKEGLAAVFRDLSIGTRANTTGTPTRYDTAWSSYRLKGSQTNFVDSMGRPTSLGNSVTEGGFVQTSSCITCHARASTDGHGTIPLPLGVFVTEASEKGYLQSARGTPSPDWYNRSAQPPGTLALQTDFVWGFLSALCLDPACGSGCPNTPSSCAAVEAPPPQAPIRHKIRSHAAPDPPGRD